MARFKKVTLGKDKKKGGKAPKEDLPSDDEVEKFHKSKDKLSLNLADDEESDDEIEDELDEEAVYNLSDSGDEDSEDDGDDEDDEEDGGRLSQCEPFRTKVL